MSNNFFTRGIGLVYLILGICGFIPGLVRPGVPTGEPRVMFHFGYLFNNFAMNWVLAGLLVVIGIAALIASVQIRTSRVFERILFTLALVLMVCGFLPGSSSMWGVMPLFGFTDGLFLATAMFSFYFAFVEDPRLPGINTPVHLHHHHHQ
jgi:hypothetical protein